MQKVLYTGVILCGILIVLSGLSIWKPVQFQELTTLFGGYDFARYVHFFAMSAIVGFLGRACGSGAAGAEEPARHDRRGDRSITMRQRKIIPGVDPKLLIKDAAKLMPDPVRRDFLRGAASLGALAFLTGCDIIDGDSAEGVLRKISSNSTTARRRYCSARRSWRRRFPKTTSTRPFPFNAYYDEDEAPEVDRQCYKLEIAGLVDNKKPWTLDELHALPEVSQITRHVCVEGWSAIGSWQGAVLSDFLKRIGADTRAKYIWFKCAEGYTNTIDMPTALHPQTQMSFKFDHKILPRAYGFPMKIRIPTKLGFKNPKYVVAMEVTNTDHGGYWENQGYNWFSGL